MKLSNETLIEEFVLIGFPKDTKSCILFFLAVLLVYFFTVFGNMFIIAAVIFSPKLHLPMYFFLWNLSFIDLCFSCTFLPKALTSILSVRRTISVTGCIVQMYIGIYLGGTESFLLTVMAYDRYVAISLPLYYNIIMNWKTCRSIIIVLWLVDFFISIVPAIAKPLVFCNGNKLDHFVCDMLQVLELACGNLQYFKLAIPAMSLLTLVLPLVFIVVSYILIISSILKIQSIDGKTKAFSTCASHLTVVFIFYGTCIGVYTGQINRSSSNLKYFTLIYGSMTPALNPLIYTLRNKDVKDTFKNILAKGCPLDSFFRS
uniref:Olfactory receptor n=2 Tax=Pyxicephalus adspersus TaxID=30357 RepID=A0AAV3ARX1_PYXAD|nr:TPA: hypothetical protein GDO54_009965 [Pyxicephalus adspersus]